MEKKSEEVHEYESWEEIELKRRRKRQREAARLALDQIQRSVAFGDDLEAEKEMGLLCGWSPYYYVGDRNRPLLSGMGLSLKHEFEDGDDEDEEVIFCGDTNLNLNLNLNHGSAIQTKAAYNIQSLSERQTARVAMLNSRFMDVISKSQHQLGLLDHRTKDLKKQQQPMIKYQDFERPIEESKTKLAATIKDQDLKKKPMFKNPCFGRPSCSSKDFKKQQQPIMKLDPTVKRLIKECKAKSATITKEQDLKKKLIVIKVDGAGIKKPRQCKSKLAAIKASLNRRRCYMLH